MLSRRILSRPYFNRLDDGRLLIACGLFIGLILAVAVGWYTITSRQGVIEDAIREMRNDALMLTEQEDRLFQTAEMVQIGLIEHMRESGVDSAESFRRLMTSREANQDLRNRIAGLSYITALSLFGRDGELLNFTRAWPPPAVNDADRDFIREAAVDGPPRTFISAPSRGRTTGQWTIYLSRKFEAPDGRIIGFVVCAIETDFFEQFYARLPLTGDAAFALYRRDGMLIARFPAADSKIGETFAGTTNFSSLLAKLDGGTVRQHSLLDGKDRLIVPRTVLHFPLIAVVSDTVDSVLRGWRGAIWVLVSTTGVLELMIGGTILLAVRHLRGHQRLLSAETARTRAEADLVLANERGRAAQTLRLQEQRFDTAVNNMPQGLMMVSKAGDVLVVNRSFCETTGVPIGSIPPGTSYDSLMRLILLAGQYSGEDLDELRRRRQEHVGMHEDTNFVLERTDGRAIKVTHRATVEGGLTTYEDVTSQRAVEARIAYLANHDALTGLPNRERLRETLGRGLVFARRGHLLALHCIDLDQFKAVNDTLGHPIGDGLLRQVGQRLRDALPSTDTIARLGGDEFAILQASIEKPIEATELASKLFELLAAPFEIEGHHIVIGASIGIAFAPHDGSDADQLLKCADIALYRAKADGRGIYRLFQAEMDAAMRARRVMELDLHQAVSCGQLELFYQPQIDVRTRRVAGCEALLRWRHPTLGLVMPDRFIPLAEETGMIVPIGEWVLRHACAAAAEWPEPSRVAVNLSAVQFKSGNLVGLITDILREAGLPANRLELEITERVMLQDTGGTLSALHQLRELGIQIAMDDFGTGYSSLSYLRRFPFDRIKIDQSFVREIDGTGDCLAIVRAMIALGRDLGMEITAEGVETPEQLEMLERAGCTELQGYLFSRPVSKGKLMGLLRSKSFVEEMWPTAAVVLAVRAQAMQKRATEEHRSIRAGLVRAI